MSEESDIVERLNEAYAGLRISMSGQVHAPISVLDEAATEITTLRATVAGLEAERDGLREALPMTADGQVATPKTDLFHPLRKRAGVLKITDEAYTVEFDDTGAGDWHYHSVGECFIARTALGGEAGKTKQ